MKSIQSAINVSTSYKEMLGGIMDFFTQKYPELTDENSIGFAKDVSRLKDTLYNYHTFGLNWRVGDFKDLFEVSLSDTAEEAKFLLSELEEQYKFNSNLIGETYILSESEQFEINEFKDVIKNEPEQITLKKHYTKDIINRFYTHYDPIVVSALIVEAWTGRTKINEQISKEATKKLLGLLVANFQEKSAVRHKI